LKLSLYDLNKALEITPRNTKYLKRLANIQMIYGNLGESLTILQKCINLEPREADHKNEFDAIQKKIFNNELIEENIKKKDFIKAEEIAEKLVKECHEFLALKITYVKILIENLKLLEAIKYILNNISSEEKNDEVDYLLALSFYYDAQ
jgi:predicted Zn-dependent protease